MTAVETVTADPVAWADRVRDDVTEQVLRCRPDDDEATKVPDIYVGWVAALDADLCPARFRASGEDGWGFPGWSAPLAGGAVGRAALLHHLQVAAHPSVEAPLPQPLEAVRAWIRHALQNRPTTRLAEWIQDCWAAQDKATLAATASTATRWLSGFVRVAGWPLPERLGVLNDDPECPVGVRWRKAGRLPDCKAVTVGSSPDAILGKVNHEGRFAVVVHRPSSSTDGAVADRAAFEATAGTLAAGIVPEAVLVFAADTGERVRFPVDDQLLVRGAELITQVVRQRVTAQDDWDFSDATPSPACSYCPAAGRCPKGQRWLKDPTRRHSGLPILGA